MSKLESRCRLVYHWVIKAGGLWLICCRTSITRMTNMFRSLSVCLECWIDFRDKPPSQPLEKELLKFEGTFKGLLPPHSSFKAETTLSALLWFIQSAITIICWSDSGKSWAFGALRETGDEILIYFVLTDFGVEDVEAQTQLTVASELENNANWARYSLLHRV